MAENWEPISQGLKRTYRNELPIFILPKTICDVVEYAYFEMTNTVIKVSNSSSSRVIKQMDTAAVDTLPSESFSSVRWCNVEE